MWVPIESGPILLGELPILTAVEDLRIGSLDDPDLGFSRISGVHVDRDGQLFVGESLLQEIRVFDLDGNFVRIIGGKGEGPGEFQYLFRWGVVGDTVWVADYQLQRTTLFDRAGRLLSAAFWAGVPVMYGTSGSSGLLSPFTMRTDGLFTGEMAVFALAVGSSRSQDSLRVPEVLFDAQGNVVDTVGWDVRPPTGPSSAERVQVGSRRYTVPQPPSDAALELEYSAGRWVVERTVLLPTLSQSSTSYMSTGRGTRWLLRITCTSPGCTRKRCWIPLPCSGYRAEPSLARLMPPGGPCVKHWTFRTSSRQSWRGSQGRTGPSGFVVRTEAAQRFGGWSSGLTEVLKAMSMFPGNQECGGWGKESL